MTPPSETTATHVPELYPAISSLRARASIQDHLQVLKASDFGNFLISAYDLALAEEVDRETLNTLISSCQDLGHRVMLDSGGYEAFWRDDATWTESRYAEAAGDLRSTLNLGFDYPQPVDPNKAEAVGRAVHGYEIAAQLGGGASAIPIVHANRNVEDVAIDVCRATEASWIAVPEKKLGEGILERSRKIASLRTALDASDYAAVRLHILGAGSPMDIGVYSMSGADSFDGLEWARCYIDPTTLRCHSAAYWELLDPDGLSRSQEIGWFAALALGNLITLRDWMDSLESAQSDGRLAELVTTHFPELTNP